MRVLVHAHTNADDFVSAHAHATAQRALDIPAALRKNLKAGSHISRQRLRHRSVTVQRSTVIWR